MGSSASRGDQSQPTTSTLNPFRKLSDLVSKENGSFQNFTDFATSISLRSFGSFGSERSCQSTISSSRPWSRVSRREWKDHTLTNRYECSKTAWPVPYMESLFLPEFKIKGEISEKSFRLMGNISTGAFGRVYKVVKIDTNEIYAMKILSKSRIISEKAIQQVKDEVKIQHLCGHHPFIANCPYYWQGKRSVYIVSSFVPNGELLDMLQRKGKFKEELVRIYVAEIATALDFLHNAGVIYRDLKLENILIDGCGHIQLIDFGLAKWLKYGARTRTICGTLQYIAPEIMLMLPYGHSVDWWSLGVVMFCLITGECPFPCSVDEDRSLRPLPSLDCTKEAKDLISRLLTAEPTLRLKSLLALKRTAFYKDFKFEGLHLKYIDLSL